MSPAERMRGRAWMRGLGVGLLTLAACGPDAPVSTPSGAVAYTAPRPEGTVLTLNGAPIQADEVDAVGSVVARIEVDHTLPYFRRIALTNVILPLVAARQVAGEKRAAARAQADAWHEVLSRGEDGRAPLLGPPAEVVEGGVVQLGLELWGFAIDAPLGTWSEPIEAIGAWRLARVLERSTALRPGDVVLRVEVRTFPWDASATFRQDVEDHLDRSKLEFVDATWRDVVPTLWQRRLRGSP